MSATQVASLFYTVFFGNPTEKIHFRVQRYLLLTLFTIGAIYWIGFFSSGNLLLNQNDWVKEDAYLTTLRFAQVNEVIPWQWNEPFYHNTDKFLANPEIVLTPDIVLLRWVSNGTFIVIHTLFFYAAGFWASIILSQKLNWKFISFFFFWLLFNFNGHPSAQLAVGHFQWTGYFLIPFFFIFLFKSADTPQNQPFFDKAPVLGTALIFGLLFLNGSVHIAIICALFLAATLLFRWTTVPNIIASILIGFLFGLNRLLPAALWFPAKNTMGQGYPSISALLDGFTALRLYDSVNSLEFGIWDWWEYDFYIGFVAFLLLVVFVMVAFKYPQKPFGPYLFKTAAIFSLLSLGNVYNTINLLNLPFVSIERVPSRFMVMPFIIFLLVSTAGLDKLISRAQKSSLALILSAFPFVIGEIGLHFQFWRIPYIESHFDNIEKPILRLVACSNQTYMLTVYTSWIASLLLLVFMVWLFLPNMIRKRN